MINAFEAFPHLLSPIKIGNVLFRNRMFGAPINAAEIEYDGQTPISGVMVYERKAMGGAAAIMVSEIDVDPSEPRHGRYPRDIKMRTNNNYARAASAITRQGAVAAAELEFAGINSHSSDPLWGPVDMTMPGGKKVVAMSEERIQEVINGFGMSAAAAKRAGFDMIVLHGAHGFGLQQFMSPTINARTDRWGGNPENRCRFAVEAIKEIRRVCGPGTPIEIRISGHEILEGGYGIDEGIRIAEQLDGVADVIHVSVGAINRYEAGTFARTQLSMFYPDGRNVEYAAEIKNHLTKSLVATVGGLCDPYHMEEIIASGQADIVYMARQLLCDPDMPNKVRGGRPGDIRKCMRCLSCFAEGVGHGDLLCALNPEIAREREVYYSLPQPRRQRVLVIGGGISGMQAALTADSCGHEVILCEKGGELGGNILCEANVPFKEHLHEYILQQRMFIERTGIDVRLNTEVSTEYATILQPDAIIAAVGSEPVVPAIPGIGGANVHQAIDVFREPSLASGKTVILGAGFVGTELAIYLHNEFNIECEIVEMLSTISDGGNHCQKQAIEDVIAQKCIPIHFDTKAIEITSGGVKCLGPEGEVTYSADTVIHAAGMSPLQEEALKFYRCAGVFHMVGECRKAADILFATSSAYTAARLIGRY
ncbi:MAG: NAD(P)/FAD-dependent oxidoreductase [Oscillospiraceae bacterium]|nr:NAD(P)/FAD-dependent oxidoreductase [Oscillospiraceae bacterium]